MPNKDPAIHRQQAREYYHRNKKVICEKLREASPERKAEVAATKRASRVKNLDKIRARDLMPARRLSTARSLAKKRGFEWALTLEQYSEIIKNPCYYCANKLGAPVQKGSGLDRLDCKIGYVIDNVVSCCEFCNVVKHDKLTPEEMKAAVKAVIEIRESK